MYQNVCLYFIDYIILKICFLTKNYFFLQKIITYNFLQIFSFLGLHVITLQAVLNQKGI